MFQSYLALKRRKLFAITGKLKAGFIGEAMALSPDESFSSSLSVGMTC